MTVQELEIQIALGTFTPERLTPPRINKCIDFKMFKLLVKAWVHTTHRSNAHVIENDDITNAFMQHPLMVDQPTLRDYLIQGRLYQKAQRRRIPFMRGITSKSRVETLEQELFNDEE